jgi:rubrerythrin
MNYSLEEVNRAVEQTPWNSKNRLLIYAHRDTDKSTNKRTKDYSDSIVGNVTNIRHNGMGSVYGNLEIYEQNAALLLVHAKAPMAVSAGVEGNLDSNNNVKDMEFKNFSLVTDPGVKEKDIFINFSENFDELGNKHFEANFENEITLETSRGSEEERHINEKSNKDDEKKKDENFDADHFELVNNGGEKEMLRSALTSELGAISLYEDMINKTSNESLKKIFLDIAKEEKTHVGEFEKLLLYCDSEQAVEMVNGAMEADKKMTENYSDDKEDKPEEHEKSDGDKEVEDDKATEKKKEDIEEMKERNEDVDKSYSENFTENTVERRLNKEINMANDKIEDAVTKITQETPQNVSQVPTEGKVVLDDNLPVSQDLGSKPIPTPMKPVSMTTNEFGGQIKSNMETAIDRIANSPAFKGFS